MPKTLVNAYRFEIKNDVIDTIKVLDNEIDRAKFPESSSDKLRSKNWIPIPAAPINIKILKFIGFFSLSGTILGLSVNNDNVSHVLNNFIHTALVFHFHFW